MSLTTIVRTLGGDLYDGGRRANIPGPGHSPHDRSVSLLLSEGRVVVHSFGRSTWTEVLSSLRDQGLIDAQDRPGDGDGVRSGVIAYVPRPERTAVSRSLWAEGRPLALDLSARHVQLRGITHAPPVSAALRHHPGVPLAVYRGKGRRLPALLAAISAPSGDLVGLEITYLDPSGQRACGMTLPRKTVGQVPPSSAVRLHPAGPELLVAEGVFTTLSAADRFGLPGWALLSTRNLRSWTPPEEVRRVLIAGDRGIDGERSAGLLAIRLRRLGRAVTVELPPAPADDWNTWARVRRAWGEEERDGEGARLEGAG